MSGAPLASKDIRSPSAALDQVSRYLDSLGLSEGWLVLFDLRSTLPWSKRLWTRDAAQEGKTIHLVGC